MPFLILFQIKYIKTELYNEVEVQFYTTLLSIYLAKPPNFIVWDRFHFHEKHAKRNFQIYEDNEHRSFYISVIMITKVCSLKTLGINSPFEIKMALSRKPLENRNK